MTNNTYPTMKQFSDWMESFKNCQDATQAANDGLRKLDSDFGGFSLSQHHNLIIQLLGKVMDDTNDWISWWIYEKEYGTKTELRCWNKKHRLLPSETVADLYRLIKNKR